MFLQCGKCNRWVDVEDMAAHFKSNHDAFFKLSRPAEDEQSLPQGRAETEAPQPAEETKV